MRKTVINEQILNFKLMAVSQRSRAERFSCDSNDICCPKVYVNFKYHSDVSSYGSKNIRKNDQIIKYALKYVFLDRSSVQLQS